jgi:hypothetical protein
MPTFSSFLSIAYLSTVDKREKKKEKEKCKRGGLGRGVWEPQGKERKACYMDGSSVSRVAIIHT